MKDRVTKIVPVLLAEFLVCCFATGVISGQPPAIETAVDDESADAAQASDSKLKSASATDPEYQVAVFKGSGVGSVANVLHDLNLDKGLIVERITAEHIAAGKLNDFDVIVFPGGSGGGQGKALGQTGREKVREFVREGGGLVGICAGAYLASADYEWSLHVLDAKVLDRKHWARGFGDVSLKPSKDAAMQLGLNHPHAGVYYHQGPLLAPAGKPEIPDYVEWASFATEVTKEGVPGGVMPGTTAIASGEFGRGRVLAISPHPEKTDGLDAVIPKAVRWAANPSSRPVRQESVESHVHGHP